MLKLDNLDSAFVVESKQRTPTHPYSHRESQLPSSPVVATAVIARLFSLSIVGFQGWEISKAVKSWSWVSVLLAIGYGAAFRIIYGRFSAALEPRERARASDYA